MDNCVQSSKKLLSLLGIAYTNQYLEDSILSHPDHPSILSITDTLEKYQIQNLSVKLDTEKLNELPLPCLVQIWERGNPLFYVLNSLSKKKVSFYNDKNKLENVSKETFIKIWTGVCLLVETSVESKEKDIQKKLTSKRILIFLKVSLVLSLIMWALVQFSYSEISMNTSDMVFGTIFFILKLIGLGAGILLLWFEIDEYNPTLQSICSGGAKVNCNSVLSSKYASLLRGNLSLSLVGFSYFFGTLFFLLSNAFNMSSYSMLIFLSYLTLPAVIISFYYQAIIIKQWCKFCIAIQIVLIAEIAIGFFSGLYKADLALESLPLLAALLTLPILVWKLVKPLLQKEKEIQLYKRGLRKIKNNSIVLNGLLAKSRKIEHDTQGLGISILNDNAKYDVIKVCNPYCGPCSKAHPILEKLVKNGKINLQVLFTAREEGDERTALPVRHLLAIDAEGDKKKTLTALNDWYFSQKKDYETFVGKHPIIDEINHQNKKIRAMRTWCDSEKITHTPTIFINGREMPKEYNVEDLDEVLN